jgi:hypothetical protein
LIWLQLAALVVVIFGGAVMLAKPEKVINPQAPPSATRRDKARQGATRPKKWSRFGFAGSRRPHWGPELESLDLTLLASNMRNLFGSKSAT